MKKTISKLHHWQLTALQGQITRLQMEEQNIQAQIRATIEEIGKELKAKGSVEDWSVQLDADPKKSTMEWPEKK